MDIDFQKNNFACVIGREWPKKAYSLPAALRNEFSESLYVIIVQDKDLFMRLSRAAEYAVRCMLVLSTAGKGVLVSRRMVAREMDIPEQFLGKIAQQLARAGLIEIVQGARGGFRLIVMPADLNLLKVIEAVIGEIFLNDCIIRPESCHRSPVCKVHVVWENARNQLRESLRAADFSSLIQETPILSPDVSSDAKDSFNP